MEVSILRQAQSGCLPKQVASFPWGEFVGAGRKGPAGCDLTLGVAVSSRRVTFVCRVGRGAASGSQSRSLFRKLGARQEDSVCGKASGGGGWPVLEGRRHACLYSFVTLLVGAVPDLELRVLHDVAVPLAPIGHRVGKDWRLRGSFRKVRASIIRVGWGLELGR